MKTEVGKLCHELYSIKKTVMESAAKRLADILRINSQLVYGNKGYVSDMESLRKSLGGRLLNIALHMKREEQREICVVLGEAAKKQKMYEGLIYALHCALPSAAIDVLLKLFGNLTKFDYDEKVWNVLDALDDFTSFHPFQGARMGMIRERMSVEKMISEHYAEWTAVLKKVLKLPRLKNHNPRIPQPNPLHERRQLVKKLLSRIKTIQSGKATR